MTKRMCALVAAFAVVLAFPAAGVTKQAGGSLNMIAWEGYLQPQWVKPFVKQTGCRIHPKYAGSSDEMVTLMRSGGGRERRPRGRRERARRRRSWRVLQDDGAGGWPG